MQNMIVLQTRPEHLKAVIEKSKRALNGVMKCVRAGDVLLIAESPPPRNAPQIWYAMRYRRMYPDSRRESEAIWGKRWRYIVEGEDCQLLDHPFSLKDVQVSAKNYGQGAISFTYLDDRDAKLLIDRSLLKPVL